MAPPINSRDVASKLKREYSFGTKSNDARNLETVFEILQLVHKGSVSSATILKQVVSFVHRQLGIREVSIATRDPVDGMYKYTVMAGMREDIWLAHKKIGYTREQAKDVEAYHGTWISDQTALFLAEDNPYAEDEEDTYSRALMVKQTRKSLDDTIEGDYLDVYFDGLDGELMGWIEISGTYGGKLPDANLIRWVEFVGSVLGLAISVDEICGTYAKRVRPAKPVKPTF